ncbi:hypothetical protein [Sinanaerobacter sp. ZZT-01]|uniref:hypothetical protein n=1 Tax=Sinanaerobacter sp. ZZT-01 TaxID=3111540 RepID=UPI002D79805E|nr:hypothetical protein [Sinanaerobacter sp. ZZT-01]WRR92440.1 hypothetical protein U5921_10245 [Sinanaerobacter sp. ZZT-01]
MPNVIQLRPTYMDLNNNFSLFSNIVATKSSSVATLKQQIDVVNGLVVEHSVTGKYDNKNGKNIGKVYQVLP